MTDEMDQLEGQVLVRVKDERALARVLGFCDGHKGNLDLQGLVDGIVTGTIVVLPLRGGHERANAARIHDVLMTVIDSTYPTLYPLVQRISAAYRLAAALAKDT